MPVNFKLILAELLASCESFNFAMVMDVYLTVTLIFFRSLSAELFPYHTS